VLRNPLLSFRGFRDLWLGQVISQFGDAFSYVVTSFMVKRLTGSDADVGLAGAAEFLPFVLIGPYAGVLADRIDRRKIMIVSDVSSGFLLLAFTVFILVTKKPPVEVICLNALLLCSSRAFFMPAKNASIPRLVPEDLVGKANSLAFATSQFMPMLGLVLSAAVLGIVYHTSPAWFYAVSTGINALSFFGSAFFIRRLPSILPDHEAASANHVSVLCLRGRFSR
jgi:MFS transporter, DHA3 family, macrolide efflux protein